MTANQSIDPVHFLSDRLEHAEPDLLRSMLMTFVDDDLGANPLMAEVLVVPARDGRHESAQTALRALEVDELPFPPKALFTWRRCVRAQG